MKPPTMWIEVQNCGLMKESWANIISTRKKSKSGLSNKESVDFAAARMVVCLSERKDSKRSEMWGSAAVKLWKRSEIKFIDVIVRWLLSADDPQMEHLMQCKELFAGEIMGICNLLLVSGLGLGVWSK